MRILVTGGAGFIGSHMVDRLLSKGYAVVVLDNLATGLRGNVSGAARFLWGDVSRLEDVERAFEDGLEAVFHIAGQVSLIRSYADPFENNLTSVINRLGVALAIATVTFAICQE
jgi:UDP-glucose 4-epimerase